MSYDLFTPNEKVRADLKFSPDSDEVTLGIGCFAVGDCFMEHPLILNQWFHVAFLTDMASEQSQSIVFSHTKQELVQTKIVLGYLDIP